MKIRVMHILRGNVMVRCIQMFQFMDTRSSALANNKFGGHDMVVNHEYEV